MEVIFKAVFIVRLSIKIVFNVKLYKFRQNSTLTIKSQCTVLKFEVKN